MDREVNKRRRAGWQGNEISSKEAFRGRFDREVNKKRKHLLLHCVHLSNLSGNVQYVTFYFKKKLFPECI